MLYRIGVCGDGVVLRGVLVLFVAREWVMSVVGGDGSSDCVC